MLRWQFSRRKGSESVGTQITVSVKSKNTAGKKERGNDTETVAGNGINERDAVMKQSHKCPTIGELLAVVGRYHVDDGKSEISDEMCLI